MVALKFQIFKEVNRMDTRLQDQRNLIDTICETEGEGSIECRMEWEVYDELLRASRNSNTLHETTKDDILRAS